MSAPARWSPRSGAAPLVMRGPRAFARRVGPRVVLDVDYDTRGPVTFAAIADSNERALLGIDAAVTDALDGGLPYLYCAGPGAPVVSITSAAQWERMRARETRWLPRRRAARRIARAWTA